MTRINLPKPQKVLRIDGIYKRKINVSFTLPTTGNIYYITYPQPVYRPDKG